MIFSFSFVMSRLGLINDSAGTRDRLGYRVGASAYRIYRYGWSTGYWQIDFIIILFLLLLLYIHVTDKHYLTPYYANKIEPFVVILVRDIYKLLRIEMSEQARIEMYRQIILVSYTLILTDITWLLRIFIWPYLPL